MKKCIVVLMMVSVLLTGCNMAFTPAQTSQNVFTPKPPRIISVSGVDELLSLKEIVKTGDEEKLQEMVFTYTAGSVETLIGFLQVVDSIPVLNLIEGEITAITYQVGVVIDRDENGNLYETDRRQEIIYITTQANNGTWVRISYALGEINTPLDEILQTADQTQSSLQKPLYAVDKRCFVYHESRDTFDTQSAQYIDWSVVIDGIPARITYCSQNVEAIKAESIFKNATIGNIL